MDIWDASDFITRDHCGVWPDWLIRFYMSGHIAVGAAYLIMPAILYFRARQVRATHRVSAKLSLMFAFFIACCGIGHLLEGVASFFWPNYRIFAIWHWVTALASVGVAAVLPALLLQLKEESNGARNSRS